MASKHTKNLGKYKLTLLLTALLVAFALVLRLGKLDELSMVLVRTPVVMVNRQQLATAATKSTLSSTSSIDLGVYMQSSPTNNFADTIAFQEILGYKLKYHLFFHAWGSTDRDFPFYYFEMLSSQGITPILTWEPWNRDFAAPATPQEDFSLSSIANGNHDEYIASWALSAKQVSAPMIIRFAHEMNTDPGTKAWYPWQGEPDNYIAAFTRVVQIFRTNSVDNVKFMWNPIFYTGREVPQQYYPGDEYVDYIGITVINLGNLQGLAGEEYFWLNCPFILNYQLNPIIQAEFNKPVIISEILTTDNGGSKAEWFEQCIEQIPQKGIIKAMVFYHSNDETGRWTQAPIDWRITSNANTLERVREGIRKFF